MRMFYAIVFSFLFAACMIACSHSLENSAGEPPVPTPETVEASVPAAGPQKGAILVSEVEFEKGRSQLSGSAQQSIRELLAKVKKLDGKHEIRVLTWSDQEYPTESQGKLDYRQRDLVKVRNRSLKKHIQKEIGGSKIDLQLYSMAERPSLIADWLSSSDAKMKQALVDAGIATAQSDDYKKTNASRSLLLVINE